MSIDVQCQDRIAMSQRERDLLKVMGPVLQGQRTQSEAARLVGLSVRQIRRIQRKLQAQGDAALVHGLPGKPSNRRFETEFRHKVLTTYRQRFAGFGPTFACEKLAELELVVGPETSAPLADRRGTLATSATPGIPPQSAAASVVLWGVGADGCLGARLARGAGRRVGPAEHDR